MNKLVSTRILTGDFRKTSEQIPSDSIHCVVTSPPYFQLRDYESEPLIWGGDPKCLHQWHACGKRGPHYDRSNDGHDENGNGILGDRFERGSQASKAERGKELRFGRFCDCGAWEGQYGLEPTISLYVQHTVEIFRHVKRVLRPDGTLWLNIGDTYNFGKTRSNDALAAGGYRNDDSIGKRSIGENFKVKDLCGVPWRVAFALQDDGWYLRCDIIWKKTNPMPESIRDRPAKSHEYIFLLTKSEDYFFDMEAIKEPVTGNSHGRGNGVNPKSRPKVPAGWNTGDGSHHELTGRFKNKQNPSFSESVVALVSKRNKRSVWTFATQACKEAHFATFPDKLVEPCIVAGTSEHGCCSNCGAPWERLTALGEPDLEWQRKCGANKDGTYRGKPTKEYAHAKAQDASSTKARILAGMVERITTGWKPTCHCSKETSYGISNSELFSVDNAPHEVVPCTVLDPFGGSGTTGRVANKLGRDAIICELKPEYVEIAKKIICKASHGSSVQRSLSPASCSESSCLLDPARARPRRRKAISPSTDTIAASASSGSQSDSIPSQA